MAMDDHDSTDGGDPTDGGSQSMADESESRDVLNPDDMRRLTSSPVEDRVPFRTRPTAPPKISPSMPYSSLDPRVMEKMMSAANRPLHSASRPPRPLDRQGRPAPAAIPVETTVERGKRRSFNDSEDIPPGPRTEEDAQVDHVNLDTDDGPATNLKKKRPSVPCPRMSGPP